MTSEKSSLTGLLQKDAPEKPILELKSLEGTAIHVPTQEDYDKLMRVYSSGHWRSFGDNFATNLVYWDNWKEETCIQACDRFGIGSKTYFKSDNKKVISSLEFYNAQEPPITPEIIKEINRWFEENSGGLN